MKRLLSLMLILGLVAAFGQAFAAVPVGSLGDLPRVVGPERPTSNLDDYCSVYFVNFTYGTYAGSEIWPGGSGTYYMTGYKLLSTCAPGDTMYAYCIDLDHVLRLGPYCAVIDPALVRPAYPEQYPAMAYLLNWFHATDAEADRVQQLTLWKLCNDERPASPTYGAPWYTINANRGAPLPGDPPVFPYVNTVYNTDTATNLAANARAHYALGMNDNIAKNVALCDDQFQISVGQRVSSEDSSYVPVTIQLVRGATAMEVGNVSVSGVKLQLTASAGSLSLNEGFTDAQGQIHVSVTQANSDPADVYFEMCTNGGWLKTIIPCEGYVNQQLISSQPCHICVNQTIPRDTWLAAELASFDARAGENTVDLSWRSLSESHLNRWEIERSESGLNAFTMIASVPATNSPSGHAYAYADGAVTRGTIYNYRLVDVDMEGTRTTHGDFMRSAGLPAASAQTMDYELAANYPNPFNPETNIRFNLAESDYVTLKVYDITGHEVTTLAEGKLAAGSHAVSFHAGNLPSGIYFYKLTSGSFTQTRKMVLAK